MNKENVMKERLLEFVKYTGLPVYQFEKLCGLSNAYIKNMSKGIGAEKLECILKQFPELNRDWLLHGVGNMLVEHTEGTLKEHYRNTIGTPKRGTLNKTLPLIPIEAVAGFNGCDAPGIRLEDCAQYTIPEFAALRADFLIRVSGSSMYPKYSSGDILACRKLTDVTFFQWGKVYVLDSNQGAMVKRLFPSESDTGKISCHSDNPNYPPFDITKDDIRSVSIVVGAIRFE